MATLLSLTPLPIIDPATVHRTVLGNGLTVLVRRDTSAPAVAVVTYVKAGYFDEPDDVVGIAHVLEHMYFKGTPTRGVGEVSKQTKAAGGYLNAHTIYDHTSYYAVLPSSGFVAGLEVQADAYANSVIDAGELAKELEVIIQEARRKADTPSAVATETLYAQLHDRHRMRRWRIGTEEGLRRLTRDDLVGFYRNFYRPRNTILSIAGDVGIDETMRHVERLYGELPDDDVLRTPGPAEPDHRDFRYREMTGDIAQTQLLVGWRTPGTLDPDTPLLDLVATVLGTGRASRLYRAVRERQLAASTSAYDYTPTELGVFVIHAETPPATTADAARGIWAQVRELCQAGAGVHEIDRARSIFESRWVRRLETMEGQANYLAEWEALGDWQLGERYLERLLTAAPEQVTEAARRHLHPDAASVVVYRPEGTEPIAEDAAGMRKLLGSRRVAPLEPPPARAAAAIRNGATPALEAEEAGVRVYRTAEGVPILVRRKPGAPVVNVGVYFCGGASEEPEHEAGLTSLMARTALKGTERRDATQIAEDAELLGGSIGVGVGAESFGWSLSVPNRHAAAALELLADVVQNPVIPEPAQLTERALAISELRLLRDDMFRWPVRLATRAAFAGHPYGAPASGTEESLAAIQAERVRAWHRARVLEGSGVIAVVGDLDPDRIAAEAARAYSDLRTTTLPPLPVPAWPREVTVSAESREKAQTALAIAFPAPARQDDQRFAAQLIAGVASGLGGRLFEELRDRQSLCYTVHAYALERRLAGMFVAYIATSPEQEEVARHGLLEQLAMMGDAPVRDDELTRAKTYAIGTHAIQQQSGSAVLGELIDAWLFGRGLEELERFEQQIMAVTPTAMRELAAKSFAEGRRVEGIVRGQGSGIGDRGSDASLLRGSGSGVGGRKGVI